MHKARFFTDRMVRKAERRVNSRKIIVSLIDKVEFGKYRNSTWEWVVLNEPGYVEWALKNIPTFDLNKEAKEVWRNRISTIESKAIK